MKREINDVMYSVSISLPYYLVKKIDAERGTVSRSEFLRNIIVRGVKK